MAKRVGSITGHLFRILINLLGVACIVRAAFMPDSHIEKLVSLIIGIWLLTMDTLDRRIKSIDESLTMIAMSSAVKDIGGLIGNMHHQWKEMHPHGAKTGDSAKAAQEADEHDTTAKTGALY